MDAIFPSEDKTPAELIEAITVPPHLKINFPSASKTEKLPVANRVALPLTLIGQVPVDPLPPGGGGV